MTQNNLVKPMDKEAFEHDGYYVLRKLFGVEEATHWQTEINTLFGLRTGSGTAKEATGNTHALADGVTTNAAFWPVIFNKQLITTVRSLIGSDIRYTQHSDLHINLPGGRWHRDNACREYGVGPDWNELDEPYSVVRIAIYLSDYSESNSSLIVLPGSHRKESKLNRMEYVLWNKLRTFLRRHSKNDLLPHKFLTSPYRVLETRPGDCVIFDQRLMHAGGIICGPKPKYSIFLSFGVNNNHSKNHREFFLDRPTYNSVIPETLRKKLLQEGLLLDHSN
jgi:hypothetical protein